jgi:hypothetical protein
MQLRVPAGILDPIANGDGAHPRRRYLLAMAVSILVGLTLSVWLAIDSPLVAPTRTTYLPAD